VEIDKSIRVLWVTWFGMLALALSFTIVCLL